MTLPKPDQRVMITGLYAGLFSQHVCVVPDASDEEILSACNAYDVETCPETEFSWEIVIRTEADAQKAGVDWQAAKPGVCQECPPRLHLVVR